MFKKLSRHLLYVAVIAFYAFFIGCPFNRITGLNCPFCGMTRAHVAFFKGEFHTALSYHPLFFLGIPFFLCVAHVRLLKRRRITYIMAVTFVVFAGAAFILVYISSLV